MILLLDNYDSFVHNLARYFRQLGCESEVIRSDRIDLAGCESLAPDAVVISPGPRRPEDAGCSLEVIQGLDPQIPVLGVCLGHQAIGVAMGGAIKRCGPMHGCASLIRHDAVALFEGCPSPLRVGRYHSLAIDESCVPTELVVTATTDDGIVMGVRHRTRPVFGLQFHPESVLTDEGQRIIRNFVGITQRCPQTARMPGEIVS